MASDTSEIASRIISAYVSTHNVPIDQLPSLIADVHRSLQIREGDVFVATQQPSSKPIPAVSIKKSINPDFLICLEDGKNFKSLKRHLSQQYGMTPDEYRAKWQLPADYPMVAPNYSAMRSALAKSRAFGRKRVEKPATAEKPKRRTIGLKFS